MFKRRTLAQLMAAAALAPASLAAQGRPPLSRIAFGSCADQAKPQPIWEAILAYRPELFIFCGDNVYGDFNTADAANLRRAYEMAENIPGYAKLRQSVDHLAVWDDHDSASMTAARSFPTRPSPRSCSSISGKSRRATSGVRARASMMCTLSGRPACACKSSCSTCAGSALHSRRLTNAARRERNAICPIPIPARPCWVPFSGSGSLDQLFKPAEIRLIVSSTQVLAEGHGWERWGNMPLERQKLIDTIRHSGAKGVVLLSGDRHVGALYRETPPSLYPLYEVTSSGLNMVYWAASEPGPNRVGSLYPSANFGVVDIDWWEYKLTLALRDEGGNTRRAITLGFDDLQVSRG